MRSPQLASAASRSSRAWAGWTLAVRPSSPKRAKSSDRTNCACRFARGCRQRRRRPAPPGWRRRRSHEPPERTRTHGPATATPAAPFRSRQQPPAAVRIRIHAVRGAGVEDPSISTFSGPTLSTPSPPSSSLTGPHSRKLPPGPGPADKPGVHPQRVESSGNPPQPHVAVPGHLEVHHTPRSAGGRRGGGSTDPGVHHGVGQAAELAGQRKRRVLPQQAAGVRAARRSARAAALFSQTE